MIKGFIKASDRLPVGRGIENSVIIRGCDMPKDIFGCGITGEFVAKGFVNFDKDNPTFYFLYGGKSYLSNVNIEWLDESPAEGEAVAFAEWIANKPGLWFDDDVSLWNIPDFDEEEWREEHGEGFNEEQFRYTTAELFTIYKATNNL